MTFELKKMGKAKLRDIERRAVTDSISPNPLSDIYEVVAQAAQLDGASQVREWGDEKCDEHPYRSTLRSEEYNRKRHRCPECWQSLNKLGVPE